jgi:hypothetical protein
MFLLRQKKIISRTFKIRGTLVFLCPKEREREREIKKGKGRGKGKEKEREGEREDKSEGDFISNLPGPE